MQDISIPAIILGASESVDLLAITAAGFLDLYETEEMAALADQRLRLRAILTDPSSWAGDSIKSSPDLYKRMYQDLVSKLQRWGWEVRVVDRKPTSNCVIVDNATAIVADLTMGPTIGVHGPGLGAEHYIRIERREIVPRLAAHFERLWSDGQRFTLLYEDLLLSSLSHVADAIVVASEERWTEIVSYFARNPEQLRNMDPRKFEELVAELLIRENMDVELTQRSKDGGRDILAAATTSLGRHLYLVECKRYGHDNKVGVSIVRGLYGIVEAERATGGVVVTTSDFTKGAVEFSNTVENRMDLKNYDAVTKWIKKHSCII